MKLRYTMLAAVIACALPLFGTDILRAQAQDSEKSKARKDPEQQSPDLNEQNPTTGYPVRNRRIGGPTDVEWDLNHSFPRSGSLLELILRGQETQNQ
jgi:hypothetical protein